MVPGDPGHEAQAGAEQAPGLGARSPWHSGSSTSVTPASQPDSHAPNLPAPFLWRLREFSSGCATETTTTRAPPWGCPPGLRTPIGPQ